MYSDAALKEELKKWLNRHGKSIKKEYGLYDEVEAKELAKQLVADIEQAFIDAQTWREYGEEREDYRFGGRITYKLKETVDGNICVHIVFPGKYLFRPSLWKDASYTSRTGAGIDDIFSLFTHGYSYSKRFPSGWWWSDSRNGEINYKTTPKGSSLSVMTHAPSTYKARPFITATINKFEAEHPNITVSYPEEWHG